MRFEFIVALCASLMALQPSPVSAQPAASEISLHPAWIVEEGIGDVIVYLSDDFRKSAPLDAEPLNLVTIHRSNPGDARNSPQKDVNSLHKYLKANSGFMAKDLVAFASSRDLVRFYFRGDHEALAARFQYPQATLSKANAQDLARLRSIGIGDFSRFIAKSATSEADLQRQILGDRAPPAEDRTLELKLRIEAGSVDKSQVLAALERKHFDDVTSQVAVGGGDDKLEFDARIRFSESLVQKVMNEVCADAARSGGQCVGWSGRFEPIHLTL
ncbi:hypothetical protein IAG41_18165 [Sphingomonas sp. JC676]|uniref:hypothetical protein n=1 Tax=Sphingomonas sp. JC676 TaxID=2768065 RepID=UPI001657938A|nr:hypothetical protein [Sphingomonas sp. JC676]MBC9034318.1 hypothetical protein [Sphingomonas sp. JC676]